MGRKKKYDLQKVLLGMEKVFVRYGYEATSIDDLQRETGILRESLCREFSSKRTMLELTLKEYLESKPHKTINLDMLLAGFQELAPRNLKLCEFLSSWYAEC